MAKKTSFPQKIVDRYIEKLTQGVKVRGVLLFGSFAWGKPTKHSDVDLVVVSPDFKKMRNRIFWLTSQREGVATSIAMDVFGYTPEEFANIEKESAIMAQAKSKGRWIYGK